MLITLALAFPCNCSPYHAILVPLTVTALILSIAYNPQFALVMSLTLTLASLISTGSRLADLLVAISGQVTAILVLQPSARAPGWSRSGPLPASPMRP